MGVDDSTEITNPRRSLPGAADAVDPPDQIGPYKILQVLGEGGMGVVYMAEQREPFERRVALKVIKLGMDTKEIIARFEVERQALAVMDHPSIARVFDAGATDSGRPYFAMELVHGVPITAYCDRERLRTRERVELFIEVCQAVQHAHQKGVIHRDLKPSNVLVSLQDGKPVPKIIDFGVAKAMDRRLTDLTLVTVLGQPVGTPSYMSPEQFESSGLDVDTRTDVYSLGVLLYQLLVGKLPFEPVDIEKRSRTGHRTDAQRPSTRLSRLGSETTEVAAQRRTDVRSLARQLRGDLDWITLKAMAVDRGRRYPTANGLASDLERYLKREPVVARPPSALYRMDRFARRHKAGVAFGAALVSLVIGFSVVTALQAGRIARERDRAELEAAKATSINTFLQDVLGSADPWERGDREMTVIQALDQSVKRIDESFREQPLVGAAVRRTIGLTYVSLARYGEADPLLESALSTRRSLLGESHDDTVESLLDMGALRRRQGRYPEAGTIAREVVAFRRRTLGEDRPELALALSELATILSLEGKFDEAEKAEEEALAIRRRVYGNRHVDVAESLYNLATIANDWKGDYKKSEALHRESLSIRRDVLGPEHADVGLSLNALAVVSLDQGDFAAAEALYKESLEIQRKVFGEEHPEVAIVMENLGGVYYRQGQYDRSIELLRQVLVLRRKMLGENHTAVARTLHNIGAVYAGAKDYANAETAYDESILRLRTSLGADHPDVATALYNVGQFLKAKGDLVGAEKTLREVLDIRLRKLGGETNPEIATARLSLGAVLILEKRFEEAERLLLEARAAREATFGVDHEDTRRVVAELEKLYQAWGKPPPLKR
jgi:serine/threonine protein kinase